MRPYPNIIGLNGVARAGKDTVAKVLHDIYGYEIKSYSDALNRALIALNPMVSLNPDMVDEFGNTTALSVKDGWTRYAILESAVGYEKAKDQPEVRALLQRMGTEVGRNMLGQDIWVDALFKDRPLGAKWAIVNVRFPNEAEAVWKRGGVVWEVTRPGFKPALGHISDTALDAVAKDAYLHNDGTVEELAQKVITLMDEGQDIKADLQAAFNGGVREG